MARFDVYRRRDEVILLLNCQNSYLDHLPTRFVVPLIPLRANPPRASRLNPVISFDSYDYLLSPNAAATVRVAQLGSVVGSLADQRDTVIAAIDMLITGF